MKKISNMIEWYDQKIFEILFIKYWMWAVLFFGSIGLVVAVAVLLMLALFNGR